MSKAFRKEDESPVEEVLPRPASLLPPGAKNYITPEGAARLREELARLTDGERPGLARALAAGNAEARGKLEALDRRAAHLRDRIASMEIVRAGDQPADRVRFGARVRVADPEGNERAYRIVGVDESDPARGEISWVSPIAKALLGCREGEGADVELPDGKLSLEILEISYE